MIWFLLIATALCALIFLFAPLFRDKENTASKPVLAGLAALSFAAIIGIYSQMGRPDLTTLAAAPEPDPEQTTEANTGNELVTRLRTRLIETNSTDPNGWRLLARSQMQIGQYDEAMQSYEMLLQITQNDAGVQAEYEQAQTFAQRQMMAAQAQGMTPDDRQAMIQGMVDGLAERLHTDGGSPEDWAKLIRARKVLKQDELLAADIELMKQQFEDQPDVIKQILGGP